jgi:hypothetical protein
VTICFLLHLFFLLGYVVALNRSLDARSRGTIREHGFVVDLEPRS